MLRQASATIVLCRSLTYKVAIMYAPNTGNRAFARLGSHEWCRWMAYSLVPSRCSGCLRSGRILYAMAGGVTATGPTRLEFVDSKEASEQDSIWGSQNSVFRPHLPIIDRILLATSLGHPARR
jgi:hypothetical protein